MKDSAYAYYTGKSTVPIVVEVVAGYVWECGDSHPRPLSHYGGRFVRLVEVPEPQEPPSGAHQDTD